MTAIMSETNKDAGGGDGEEAIDDDIKGWRTAMTGAAILCVLLYWIGFSFAWSAKEESSLQNGWANFGTFFGGTLGPVVAFAAFYWLTESVRIQRVELKKAHKALLESAAAQKEQSDGSKRLVELNALSTLAQLTDSQLIHIQQRLAQIEAVFDESRKTGKISTTTERSLNVEKPRLLGEEAKLKKDREDYLAKISKFFKEN